MGLKSVLFALPVFFSLNLYAAGKSQSQVWIDWRKDQSIQRMLANISPAGAATGAVIASPEKNDPPYFYHWVRDAALTMNTVFDLYLESAGLEKQKYQKLMIDFVQFSSLNQQTMTLTGLGEPKFYPDGRAYNEGWCRPQNDGPALRASVLIRFAKGLLAEGDSNFVSEMLYSSDPKTVIRADLDYIAAHWRDGNCELWEEVYGDHFYNRLVQMKALLQGAELATQLNDSASAFWYRSQSLQLQYEIEKHWKADRGLFLPTLGESGHAKGKFSGLDASVILAVLHSAFDEHFIFEPNDSRVLSNFHQLVASFASLYPINHSGFDGVVIGRYPEDVYGGTHFERGNPWVLITAAFANFSYKNSIKALKTDRLEEAKAWYIKAESFLSRIQRHGNPDGSLSEQIDAETGYMVSAKDLTWSHVEVLQALKAREQAQREVHKFGIDTP